MFTLLNQLLDACVVINESGVIQFFNAAAEKRFGWRATEIIGNNVKVLMPKVREYFPFRFRFRFPFLFLFLFLSLSLSLFLFFILVAFLFSSDCLCFRVKVTNMMATCKDT